jgi:PBP1b-binding outer membrane lipoprotein LpoB
MIILLLLSPIYLWAVLLILTIQPKCTPLLGPYGDCRGCGDCGGCGGCGGCKAYEYNTILTKETDRTEFKSFFTDISTINSFIDTSMSSFGGISNSSLKLLQSGYWFFNPVTIKTIKTYCKTYLPKYIACYSHPYSTSNGGEFYIGIDDDGVMHGIPYKGELKINFKKIIDKIFEGSLMSCKDNCINEYKQCISVELIKLLTHSSQPSQPSQPSHSSHPSHPSQPSQPSQPSHPSHPSQPYKSQPYQYYIDKLNTQEKLYHKYLLNKKKWEDLFSQYTSKLHELLNKDTFRLEIIEYIRSHSSNNYDLIADLRTGKKYKQQTFTEISKIKDDKTNIFYWVIRFKDARISFLKSIKPKCPKLYYNDNTPNFLLCNTPLMIPTWLERNTSLNLYIIKITIGGNISPTKYLKYKDKITKKWKCGYRTMHNHLIPQFPRCEPII